jgi:hypothetical protein
MNKLEIIQEINTLKRNKYKCQNTEQYYYKLNSLYKKLSDANGKSISQPIKEVQQVQIIYNDELNLSDDEKISKVIDDIMNFATHSYLLEKHNVKLLSKKYPLFDLFLIENNLIEKNDNVRYEIQIKPILENNVDEDKFIKETKFLFKLFKITKEKNNCVLIVLILFDLIFKNFSFCLNNKKFGTQVKNKLMEFKLDAKIFTNMENKYNLVPDIITKWYDEIEKLILEE